MTSIDVNPTFDTGGRLWKETQIGGAAPEMYTDADGIPYMAYRVKNDAYTPFLFRGLVDDTGAATIHFSVAGDVVTFTGTVHGPYAGGVDAAARPYVVALALGGDVKRDPWGDGTPGWTLGGGAVIIGELPEQTDKTFSITATVPADYVASTDNGLCLIVAQAVGGSYPKAATYLSAPAASYVRAVVPDPDPDPEPEPTEPTLGERVAIHLGKKGNPAVVELATAHAAIISDYVFGYTRGRGFDKDKGEPVRPLRSVIVAATARLTGNPEQVVMYSTGDYTERPAVMAGWLLHELAVLNGYRRRQS